jgi:putative toxin-antitoxin system antitoxin component (TIGR02293 family)
MPTKRKISVVKLTRAEDHSQHTGVPVSQYLLLVEQIRQGIPATAYTTLAQRLGVSKTELATKLRISPRTILNSRRKKLSSQESEKMVRVRQIFDEAENIFGSSEEARTWINTPQRGLEFHKPIEMLDTDVGAGYVRDYLGAIKYGNVW